MGPDLTETAIATPGTRCPACAAAVRPDAPWCTQCYFDLRPAPAPVPTPVAPPAPAPPAAAPPAAPAPDPLTAAAYDGHGAPTPPPAKLATWPCTRCGAVNALEEPVCASCGGGFMAALKDDEAPLLVLPGVGDITRLSRGQRALLAGAFVLVLAVLTVLAGLLLS